MNNISHIIGGVPYQATDGFGRLMRMTPSARTNYSLPGVLTPRSRWFATPFSWGSFIPDYTPVYPDVCACCNLLSPRHHVHL